MATTKWKAKKAEKKAPPLSIGISGKTGTGKTTFCLELGSRLAGKERVCLVTTERYGHNWQADRYDFDVIVWEDVITGDKPFRLEELITCIQDVANQGYGAIIIDQFSEFWTGPGGIMDEKPQRQIQEWQHVNQRMEPLLQMMKEPPCHLIMAMQARRESMGKDKDKEDGKLRPIQREDTFRMLMMIFMLDDDHSLLLYKDRVRLEESKLWRAKQKHFGNTDFCAAFAKHFGETDLVVHGGEEMTFDVLQAKYLEGKDEMILRCANEFLIVTGLHTNIPVDGGVTVSGLAEQQGTKKLEGNDVPLYRLHGSPVVS